MTRDFDLIRDLLMFFDKKEDAGPTETAQINIGYTELLIKYHLLLLYQAGLLDCEPMKSSTSDRVISVIPFNLTWQGHEFLAKIRSDTVWQKIKTKIISAGGSHAFTVIERLATKAALDAVDLGL
jgi:hypothetical protein